MLMFDNAGSKVKKIAKVFFWIAVVAYAISGVVMMFGGGRDGAGGFFVGLLTIALGVLIAWLGTISMYAIGEAAEQSGEANSNLTIATEKASQTYSSVQDLKSTIERLQGTVNELQRTVDQLKASGAAPAEPAEPAAPSVPKLSLTKTDLD